MDTSWFHMRCCLLPASIGGVGSCLHCLHCTGSTWKKCTWGALHGKDCVSREIIHWTAPLPVRPLCPMRDMHPCTQTQSLPPHCPWGKLAVLVCWVWEGCRQLERSQTAIVPFLLLLPLGDQRFSGICLPSGTKKTKKTKTVRTETEVRHWVLRPVQDILAREAREKFNEQHWIYFLFRLDTRIYHIWICSSQATVLLTRVPFSAVSRCF